ncbi:uncharacterized protein TRAVEDRAFT_165463 [Trametes versicolor FP-101664 SS1]|uniref:uncharacterized protein n=1 Tax=Trametes versicolor (strain FP-101664) TaxID=717944 RepID=UPI0004623DF8|nr:uncharacterized protein TRAVEDRAFT_165463 [Trametes versicolor FP-101664 SS1]EIW60570.1 hypothetical protein TRAVEDRAFT_165463 [Trametes versicolor FP-101664 SS1]
MSHDEGSTQFGYEDPFTPARTKKKRKNRPPVAPPPPDVLLNRASEELAEGDWLRETQQSLRDSLEEAFAASDAAPDVLCLGLGSPASSRDACAQLAFLLAACDDLSIDHTKVSVYDPVFAEQDLRLLTLLGLTALPENRQASYGLRSPTIVFMPHCDLHLYENLLRENWTRARLPHVLLIANRLREYAESIPSRKLASEHPCVARLTPFLTSRPLAPCAQFPTAFNNTAIQYVRADALADRPADWWTLPGGAPATDDVAGTPPAPDARDISVQRQTQEAPTSESVGPPDARPNAAAGEQDADADANTRANGDATSATPPSPPRSSSDDASTSPCRTGSPGAGSGRGLENGEQPPPPPKELEAQARDGTTAACAGSEPGARVRLEAREL